MCPNKAMSIESWGTCGIYSLLVDNGLSDDLSRGLVSGNSSLGNKVAHIVSGGLDNWCSLVV